MTADAFSTDGVVQPEISASELCAELEAGTRIVLLDVRESHERDIADLPDHGQVHIPMAEVPRRIDELNPSELTVVYCRSGGRSGAVVEFLRASGFARAVNLRGGVLGWRSEVDPTLPEY